MSPLVFKIHDTILPGISMWFTVFYFSFITDLTFFLIPTKWLEERKKNYFPKENIKSYIQSPDHVPKLRRWLFARLNSPPELVSYSVLQRVMVATAPCLGSWSNNRGATSSQSQLSPPRSWKQTDGAAAVCAGTEARAAAWLTLLAEKETDAENHFLAKSSADINQSSSTEVSWCPISGYELQNWLIEPAHGMASPSDPACF